MKKDTIKYFENASKRSRSMELLYFFKQIGDCDRLMTQYGAETAELVVNMPDVERFLFWVAVLGMCPKTAKKLIETYPAFSTAINSSFQHPDNRTLQRILEDTPIRYIAPKYTD
jgi:hypothetical protein